MFSWIDSRTWLHFVTKTNYDSSFFSAFVKMSSFDTSRSFRKWKKLILKRLRSLNENQFWFIDLKNESRLRWLNFKSCVIFWQMLKLKKISKSLFRTYFVMLKQFIWIRFKINWSWLETRWTVSFVFKYWNQRLRSRLNNF